uniref:Uncharacterized protein n=1 Tax=Arundo donax TaxID=35708 RepID=A0A0A9ADQ0_ARUDO
MGTARKPEWCLSNSMLHSHLSRKASWRTVWDGLCS